MRWGLSTSKTRRGCEAGGRGKFVAVWNALLQPTCLGCALEPGPICPGCAAALAACSVRVAERDGLVHGFAAPHEPPASRLVVAFKESGARSLGPLLAALLARPVVEVLRSPAVAASASVTLLPIPQRPRNRLRRPQDPVVYLVGSVAALLRDAGPELGVSHSLRWVRGGPDQSRLGAADRRGNVHGALSAGADAGSGPAILVDDVVTTGATALEAARAARAAGWDVTAVVSLTHSVQRTAPV